MNKWKTVWWDPYQERKIIGQYDIGGYGWYEYEYREKSFDKKTSKEIKNHILIFFYILLCFIGASILVSLL